jgi:hypothetical protein
MYDKYFLLFLLIGTFSSSLKVTVHCCLHEKAPNPYYTLILQRFCAYDRRFQVIKIQFFDKIFVIKMFRYHYNIIYGIDLKIFRY